MAKEKPLDAYRRQYALSLDLNRNFVEQFETSIQEHKELKVDTSYSNESRNLYEEIQELQNKINRE